MRARVKKELRGWIIAMSSTLSTPGMMIRRFIGNQLRTTESRCRSDDSVINGAASLNLKGHIIQDTKVLHLILEENSAGS